MSGEADRHREILPIPDRRYPGDILYAAKDPVAKFPPLRSAAPA